MPAKASSVASGVSLLNDGDGQAFVGAALVILHGDVQVHVAAGSLEAEDGRFGILAGFLELFLGDPFRRENLELESLVI